MVIRPSLLIGVGVLWAIGAMGCSSPPPETTTVRPTTAPIPSDPAAARYIQDAEAYAKSLAVKKGTTANGKPAP